MFSEELPLFTLCEMLGVDEVDRPEVKVWMHHLELATQFLAHPWRTFFAGVSFRFNSVVKDMFTMESELWQIDGLIRERTY